MDTTANLNVKINSEPNRYSSSIALEAFLGDPFQPSNEVSYQKSIELDEAEQFPQEYIALLDEWGLHKYYIPQNLGGKLILIEEIFSLMRCVSRRDLTLAIAHGNVFLGTIPVWIGGELNLKKHVAEKVKLNYKIALGLSEKQHGSDLLNGEVTATRVEDGYTINGEKWLVNNCSLGNAITVLARTDNGRGYKSFSLFYVEKNETNFDAISYGGKIKTMGVRGLDMNSIRFNQCCLKNADLIKGIGSGLEVTMKSMQVTRAMCASFSLGAADTAFRITVQFALTRNLFNREIIHLPVLREKLTNAFADILICECLSAVANRALHTIPGQFSILSAVIKSLIPNTVDKTLVELSTLLGARYYLREEYKFGIFQKIVRDHATISFFDGNTAVNLQAILQQLRLIATVRQKEPGNRLSETEFNLETIYSLDRKLPEFNSDKLDIFNRGKDDLIYGLLN